MGSIAAQNNRKRPPRKGEGRPTKYTKELGDLFCQRIANGWSMRTVCDGDDMPVPSTIFEWIRNHEEFSKQYAQATEERTEAHQEKVLEIGDESIQAAQDSDPKAASAVVQAYKLKADNLKWHMSKMKPKKYGDKVDVTSAGEAIKGNTILFKDFDSNGTNGQ